MINCEFELCIYNQDNECSLPIINISPLGLCDDCILPDFDDKTLIKYKKETLNHLKQSGNY